MGRLLMAVLILAIGLRRSRRDLLLENLALRQQLAVLKQKQVGTSRVLEWALTESEQLQGIATRYSGYFNVSTIAKRSLARALDNPSAKT